MKTILHVGCGSQDIRSMPSYFQDGTWSEIRFDLDQNANPDIIGDIKDLSLIEDGSIDVVYSSHNIEHVSAFEVPWVLEGFRRVLLDSGFVFVSCPDIKSVAKEIFLGQIDDLLYNSPGGPINALDIIYGHQKYIQQGHIYMAHKTAFTAETLAKSLLSAGFIRVHVARDIIFGLHAIAFKKIPGDEYENEVVKAIFPRDENILESFTFPEEGVDVNAKKVIPDGGWKEVLARSRNKK